MRNWLLMWPLDLGLSAEILESHIGKILDILLVYILMRSTLQSVITIFATEVEYMAASEVAKGSTVVR